MTTLFAGAVLAATIALVADWRTRRIPNWLTSGALGVYAAALPTFVGLLR